MASLNIPDLLPFADIKLFRNVPSSDIQLILSDARTRRFTRGSVITHQGEPSEHFYLLCKGRARYFYETPNGKKLILRWLAPGHTLGLATLLSDHISYLVSAETVQESVALVWSGRRIQELARRFPQLLENALMIATDYMTWYVTAHASLSSQMARERLAYLLIELGEAAGHKLTREIEVDVTNEELASAANISPYTVSRMISGWQKAGAIRKRRGKIVVCSTKLLPSKL